MMLTEVELKILCDEYQQVLTTYDEIENCRYDYLKVKRSRIDDEEVEEQMNLRYKRRCDEFFGMNKRLAPLLAYGFLCRSCKTHYDTPDERDVCCNGFQKVYMRSLLDRMKHKCQHCGRKWAHKSDADHCCRNRLVCEHCREEFTQKRNFDFHQMKCQPWRRELIGTVLNLRPGAMILARALVYAKARSQNLKWWDKEIKEAAEQLHREAGVPIRKGFRKWQMETYFEDDLKLFQQHLHDYNLIIVDVYERFGWQSYGQEGNTELVLLKENYHFDVAKDFKQFMTLVKKLNLTNS